MLKHQSLLVGMGLLSMALGGGAATLGRAQGSAWIGSPLELSVQLQLADGEELSANCLQADVFHGDARQDASRVRITLEPTARPQTSVARIVSATAVDEPVVTVYLRAGCTQQNSRRYVLLAELPNNQVTPQAATAAVASVPLITPAAKTAPAPSTAAASPQTPAEKRKPRPAPAKAAAPLPEPASHAPPAAAPVAVAVQARKPPAPLHLKGPGKARLKLDLLELTEERSPVLKSSPELISMPADNAQARSEAAALWRALNATPQDSMRESARLQNMQTEVSALTTLTAQNHRGLTELVQRLQQAEEQRYANWLVYALTGLLLLMLTALLWLWRQRARPTAEGAWHGGLPAAEVPDALDLDLDTPHPPAKATPRKPPP